MADDHAALLSIDLLTEVGQEGEWDKLVLPKGHRSIVQAMVETHARKTRVQENREPSTPTRVEMDLVRGKGSTYDTRLPYYSTQRNI